MSATTTGLAAQLAEQAEQEFADRIARAREIYENSPSRSRDFGRGFAHAMALIRAEGPNGRPPAPAIERVVEPCPVDHLADPGPGRDGPCASGCSPSTGDVCGGPRCT